jgi:hypothetical protein
MRNSQTLSTVLLPLCFSSPEYLITSHSQQHDVMSLRPLQMTWRHQTEQEHCQPLHESDFFTDTTQLFEVHEQTSLSQRVFI